MRGTLLGTASLTKRGIATLYNESAPLPVAAADAIYAVYSGDTNFSGSQASATETVDQAATSTTLTASTNPGVAGADATFTAVVTGLAPHWSGNGGQTAPPTGTVTFTVNGTAVPAGSVTFVGQSGASAIYTYTVPASSLTGTPNTVTATYSGGANYQASSSRTLHYQVLSAADAGSGTIIAGSAASPLSLRGGQTFSINYSSTATTPPTSNTVTYTDADKGISLTGTITSVVFSADGKEAEITGTGTNTNGTTTTPVNFTMLVNANGGSFRNPNFEISIVGNSAVTGPTGAGFEYHRSDALAAGNTITISQTGSTATISSNGGPSGAHDHVLESWPEGRGGSGRFNSHFGGFGTEFHGRRR
jgi:hypothetical protein